MLIFDPIGAVGEDNNGDPPSMSVSDDALAKELSTNALFVISDDNGVERAIESVMNEGAELVEKGVGVGGIVIEVEPEDLMIVSDDADFGSSRVGGEDEAAGGDFVAVEQFHEGFAVVVFADEASECRGSP